MPDLPDIRKPLPDRAHEALRQSVVTALDDLTEQIQRINDTWLLLLGTTRFAQATLNTAISGQAAIAQMQTTAAQLGKQIAAVNTRAEAAQINAKTALDNADVLQQQVAALDERVTALEPEPTPSVEG